MQPVPEIQFIHDNKELCENARINEDTIYGANIRSTITDILRSCYPVFFSSHEESFLLQIVDRFLVEHKCVRPYHHQIPTEFLCFYQNLAEYDAETLRLLELEWSVLDVELNEHHVEAAGAVTGSSIVTLNATVRFLLCSAHNLQAVFGLCVDTIEREIPLALYRDGNDRIISKVLTKDDCNIIPFFQNNNGITWKKILQLTRKDIDKRNMDFWFKHAISSGLLVVRGKS